MRGFYFSMQRDLDIKEKYIIEAETDLELAVGTLKTLKQRQFFLLSEKRSKNRAFKDVDVYNKHIIGSRMLSLNMHSLEKLEQQLSEYAKLIIKHESVIANLRQRLNKCIKDRKTLEGLKKTEKRRWVEGLKKEEKIVA